MRLPNTSTECEQGYCHSCPLTTGEWDEPKSCACDCGHVARPRMGLPASGACSLCKGAGRINLGALSGIYCPACLGRSAIICAWCGAIESHGTLPASHGACPKCLALEMAKIKKPSTLS